MLVLPRRSERAQSMPETVERPLPDASARLRILILGWLIGRGSTGVYGAELADYLSRRGHAVTCLSAGTCDWRLRPHLRSRRAGLFDQVDLINPPIVCATRPTHPEDEIASPDTERLLTEILGQTRPDVVLILDFPGWPARTVEVCRAAGSKVAVFLQNFWPFCTRLSLLDRWGAVCRDYANGERCVECTRNMLGSGAARWRNRLPAALWRSAGTYAALRRAYRIGARARSAVATHLGASYAARRGAYARAIASADLLCGISSRTIELAAQFGVHCPNTTVVPIVLRHLQAIRRERASRLEGGAAPARRSIRFGYLGMVAPEKGIGFLVEAFRDIPNDVAVLHCFGGGAPNYLKALVASSDRANPPVFHGPYVQSELAALLRGVDIGVVPSNCEDTRPNTVLEFQAAGIPVLGSRIGGIPEQIEDGRNGMLFEAGDAASLRRALDTVIRSPELVEVWRANLPSEFDPEVSWRELERSFCDLKSSSAAERRPRS